MKNVCADRRQECLLHMKNVCADRRQECLLYMKNVCADRRQECLLHMKNVCANRRQERLLYTAIAVRFPSSCSATNRVTCVRTFRSCPSRRWPPVSKPAKRASGIFRAVYTLLSYVPYRSSDALMTSVGTRSSSSAYRFRLAE